MLDLIKRILVTLISAAVIIYTGSLIASQTLIVQPEHNGMNMLAFILMILVAGYMIIVYGIYPLYHPMQKRILTVIGV